MKRLSAFLSIAAVLMASGAFAAPVATTLGSNLTAYNSASGAINNAMWNNMINPRANSSVAAPTADFGNCNAVILRCAQPKCANGGCASMDIARPIVVGCVESNSACKQYGDELVEYISAQLVSSSNASMTQAATDAQIAAAQAASAQSSQQIAQMQQQMAQMQQQMQQQSADTAAQIQAALAQQQQATAQAIADAATAATQQNNAGQTQNTTATSDSGITMTAAQQAAAQSGVSADLLAREQISGQILTKIENAEVALKTAQAAMNTAMEYAGCDSSGSNCSGPRRVSAFKQKASQFFDPYNDVLDELYDALILAQSVGVDITDIYMMLNGTCNAWGQYLCSEGQVMHYNQVNCPDGTSVSVYTNGGTVFGGAPCKIGQVVPMSDGGCQLIKVLADEEEVQRNWLYPETGSAGAQVRVGCASEILDNSPLFRSRNAQADIDIETLQRIIEQDAPSNFGSSIFNSTTTPLTDGIVYCAISEETYRDLQDAASLKKLPDKVCVTDSEMRRLAGRATYTPFNTNGEATKSVRELCANTPTGTNGVNQCLCENSQELYMDVKWNSANNTCECGDMGYEFDYNTLTCNITGLKDTLNSQDASMQRSVQSDINNFLDMIKQ